MEQEKTPQEKSPAALREEAVLQFWKEQNIFEKTLTKESPKGEFVFYDGPPTANGRPGIHHLEARAFKDAIPRYKTMQGFHVRRKGGWDTHGLPVELQVEKALGLKSKKEIEQYGIEKFNAECKKSVWTYIDEWQKFTDRTGFWVDSKNPYRTYDASYIQSLWNVVGKVNDQGLLYKDYKVVPYCPRCGTALSSHELAQGYQDDTDLSVTAKFKVVGQENTYLLAWTTTPWTLPGNVGLAVGEKIEYLEVEIPENFNPKEFDMELDIEPGKYLFSKERAKSDNSNDSKLHKLFFLASYKHIQSKEIKGKDLVGLEYEPLYPFMGELDKGDEKLANAYKVYVADFVNTTDGTGIVHTAVMYGQDDFELGTKVGLPKFHLVQPDGTFIKGTGIFEGRFVKDEDVAVDVIKDLAHRGLLFKKEKYTHSYPHCWRCSTPLIYYARDSWYIGMSQLRDKLVAENESINWEPSHVKEGRFGQWLADIKDWAISRERYWGTPLPIWVADDGEKLVVDSFETLKKYTKKSGNKYFVMRHGGTEGNIQELVSYKNQVTDNLTKEGKKQVVKTAQKLGAEKIDFIIASPFTRTKETTQILKEALSLTDEQVIFDDRLVEVNPGDFDGKNWNAYHDYIFKTGPDWFDRQVPNGESLKEVAKRTGAFLYDLEEKYRGKNILIVTHGGPAWLMFVNAGLHVPDNKTYQIADTHAFVPDFERFHNAEVRALPFVPLPHNENYELDPHKPFIDDVILEKDGKQFTRVKEVMDVWFDSGAMPFAQDSYPFLTDKLYYPADFIAEGLDQTRGWFYTLHAVGALMGMGKAYKNVICLGLILDKDGKKMSKSVGNVVDPWTMMDKYGADTLRLWMYSVNQPGDSKNFDEKTVHELHNKVFNLLYNVLSFYELYRDNDLETFAHSTSSGQTSSNVLDVWILARLNQLTQTVTENLDGYKLLEPVRAIRDFIDDLSTWYLRRSRDRIKEGDESAKKTLYTVLKTLAQLLAPVAPFAAEDLWLKLKGENEVQSVHLTEWPKAEKYEEGNIAQMQLVRDLCTVGNALRKKANIPVRQPLAFFFVTEDLTNEYKELIKEELNVKAVEKGTVIVFDERITPELKREGDYRELIRTIQDLRKEKGLMPSDVISLTLANEYKDIVSGFEDDLKKTVTAKEVSFVEGEEKIKIEE